MFRSSAILAILMLLAVSCRGKPLDSSTAPTSPLKTEPDTSPPKPGSTGSQFFVPSSSGRIETRDNPTINPLGTEQVPTGTFESLENFSKTDGGIENTIAISDSVRLQITGLNLYLDDDVLNYVVYFTFRTKQQLKDLEKLRSVLPEQVSDLKKRIAARSLRLAKDAHVKTAGPDTEDSQQDAYPKPLETDYFKDLIEDYNHQQKDLVARIRNSEFGIFDDYVTFRKQLESLGGKVTCDELEKLGQGQLGSGKGSDLVVPDSTDAQKKAFNALAERIRNNFAKIFKGSVLRIFPGLHQRDSQADLHAESRVFNLDDEAAFDEDLW